MKKTFSILLASIAMTTVLGIMTGCNQKVAEITPTEEVINPDDPAIWKYNYSLLIPAANEAQTVVLREFTKPIYKIDNPASWITIDIKEELEDGCQVLEITSTQADKEQEATITIKSEAREEIKITVMQGKLLGPDDGANADFFNDWENYSEIKINGKTNPVATPWNVDNQSNIPIAVTDQYKKEHGWEMAFCSLSNTATDRICYFGLYNRHSGTLRVFHYLNDPAGYGQEISYQVWMGDQDATNVATYYNSLEFGVPANHKFSSNNLSRKTNLVGSSMQTQSFMTWVTPYMRYSSNLVEGWYCFDLDMTGYAPGAKQWRDVDDKIKMSIVPVIRNTQNITLRGTLAGDLGGTFDMPQTIVQGTGNCLSGVCGTLNMIGGMMNGQLGSASQYAASLSQPATAKMGTGAFIGGMAVSAASSLLGLIGSALTDEKPTVTYIPGKIDMKLDAQLDLAGTISNFTSSREAIYNVTLSNINATNGEDGNFGRGIWSLAQDPVIYIDREDLMADYDHFTIYGKSGNQYYSSDFNEYGVRYVYFLDPNSIKLNINTELFPDIENVTVAASCGVYPSRQSGYATAYRSLLMLDNPEFDITPSDYKEVVRFGPNSSPRILQVKPQELLTNDDVFETPANSKKVQQKGGSNYYYGYLVNAGNKDIIANPQVYMNITTPNGHINNPTFPTEVLVSVQITFESGGNTYLFTKCFVPKIEYINRDTTLQKSDEIAQFVAKCDAKQPTGVLANQPAINVYSPNGSILFAKTLRMLKRVKEGK